MLFRNHYECPRCDYGWSDIWSCQVDDECGNCGLRDISPIESEDIDDDDDDDDDEDEESDKNSCRSAGSGWPSDRLVIAK